MISWLLLLMGLLVLSGVGSIKRLAGGDMEKSTYDVDGNAVVDRADGVKNVDDLPESPSVGDIVVKDGRVYVYVSE